MNSFFNWLHSMLEHPVKIGFIGLAMAFAGLLCEGTLIDLYNLKTEKWHLQSRYIETLKANQGLQFRIEQARNSDKFIGRQAREKLDLIKDDELVFIFENEGVIETPITAR